VQCNWVDFRLIKQTVTIEAVLGRYGIKLRRSGKELRGRCPIHNGEGTDSFHASVDKNAFNCFSCHAKGNVLDLVAALEQCSVREAGQKLQDWFGIAAAAEGAAKAEHTNAQQTKLARGETDDAVEDGEGPNKPLGFRLKGIDHSHPYLAGRGIDSETAEYFGIGYFSGRGSMHGRIVIPIENERGELVAYAGRSIDNTEPKYKLPPGFKKSQVVYNLGRAREEGSDTVVVAEGFFDCIRVTLAGYASVALMGCAMSRQQQALLTEHFRRVILMLDGDEAGVTATTDICARLARHVWVRAVELGSGRQPDELTTDDIEAQLRGIV
jgi:DNA primase